MPKLLIVDDDENNRIVATDALECDDYELAQAVDGHDCLLQVAEQSFDLILLDVMMPGIDGIETLRKLKADEAARDIPVIMVTALNMDSQVAACLDEGAVDHVSKPFSGMILRARVRAALRSKANSPAGGEATLPRGKTLALVGAKGGVGATTLAVNLAAKLVQVGKTATICEMQPNAASMAVQLGLTPHRRPGQLWDGEEVRITGRKVEEHLLNHASGLRVLLGPAGPNCGAELTPEAVGELVQVLRGLAQYTMLDVGNCQSQAGYEFLRQADSVMLVLEMEPCSLFAAQRRLDHFAELGIQPGVLGAVINNRVHLPSPAVSLKSIREQLSCDIMGIIPADPEGCFASIHQAGPIVLTQPECTTAGAIATLANRVSAECLTAIKF